MEENLEEMADNVDEVVEVHTEQPASPADNGAKAYAERLNRDRERIRSEERERIAQDFGYTSWDEYREAQTNSKLLDNGLDPETVRPVLKDIIKSDPDYIEAMEYKKREEALKAREWGEGEVRKLNSKFGTTFNSIDELDEETVKLFNNGMSLEKAYVSQHYDELEEKAIKKAKIDTGKEHLKKDEGTPSTETVKKVEVTDAEFRKFKSINPYATDEEIKAYIERTRK